MDGNRRWAKSKLLPKLAWHKVWADNVVTITEAADELWIKYLTLRALSTENLIKRDSQEVNGIIKLVNNIESFLDKMIKKWLKFETIWDLSKLPTKSQDILQKVKDKTKNNTWITLIVALIYGWQDEIVRAIRKANQDWIDMGNIDTDTFRKYLDTCKFPNPDLIIRTWWDVRHSGFMLYNSAYSEYYYTDKYRPAFDKTELKKSIEFFNGTKRNFGK